MQTDKIGNILIFIMQKYINYEENTIDSLCKILYLQF